MRIWVIVGSKKQSIIFEAQRLVKYYNNRELFLRLSEYEKESNYRFRNYRSFV